jgi:hypothetical protein
MSRRLIDQLRASPVLTRPFVAKDSQAWHSYALQVVKALGNDDVFIASIDGVAREYFVDTHRDKWNLSNPLHFPTLAPPRPVMWFEYGFPRTIETESESLNLALAPWCDGGAGALVLSARREDVIGLGIPEETASIVVIDTFFNYGSAKPGEIVGPHGAWTIALDQAGRILGCPWCHSFTANDPEAARVTRLGLAWIHPPLLALSRLPNPLPDDQMEVTL